MKREEVIALAREKDQIDFRDESDDEHVRQFVDFLMLMVNEVERRTIEKCIDVIENYKVPVGNSAAGEMAAEWTMDALREVRDEIRALANQQ